MNPSRLCLPATTCRAARRLAQCCRLGRERGCFRLTGGSKHPPCQERHVWELLFLRREYLLLLRRKCTLEAMLQGSPGVALSRAVYKSRVSISSQMNCPPGSQLNEFCPSLWRTVASVFNNVEQIIHDSRVKSVPSNSMEPVTKLIVLVSLTKVLPLGHLSDQGEAPLLLRRSPRLLHSPVPGSSS